MKYGNTVKASKAFSFGLFIFCVLLVQSVNLSAQPARIKHVIERVQKDKTQYLGRDLWFTMPQNYESQGGKYYRLYVVSPNNTTVHIQVTGGTTSRFPITAGQVLTFTVPLSWEVTTSGTVEQKGIRVWSDDADLTGYLLSRNPATSDGFLIIPTIGWGTEYVVAAYASLYEGYGSFVYDYASEFTVIANQDNTLVTIVPSVDLRMSNPDPIPVRKVRVPFTEKLDRGECIQYKAVLAQNCDEYDVTGTVVTSNKPIGVAGASQCPNIPCENPYCDHVCDMMPPVRTWAQTYQTVPFDQRVAGDSYCVIGSVPGQTIYRNKSVYCTLTNKYDYYFRPDVSDASLWESSAPFLLVQYINSSTYEGQNGGSSSSKGDPAEVVVNSVEQYVPHIIFQTPNIQGSDGFSNFCNIMVNNDALLKTTYDGKPINSAKGGTRIHIPNTNYTAFRIPQVEPGKHEVVSDSGVGVYIYGYGSYDSYAWSGALGLKTFNDPDTIPPVALPSGVCFDAQVTMADNHIAPPASRISEMKLDSVYNMSYTPDPLYQIGVAADSTYYQMSVIDNTKEAYLKTETHDYAGNRTIVTSTYTPQLDTLTPALNNYGSGNVGVKTSLYFTISNTGTIPYSWQYIKLLLGNQGFTIDSGLVPNTPIPVGGSRMIKVGFLPQSPSLKSDTLELSDGCSIQQALVIGTGGAPDFNVTGEDFGCTLVGTTTKLSDATIINISKSLITIDAITVDDPLHFGFSPVPPPVTNKLPFTLAANGKQKIEFSFSPDKTGPFQTIAHFHSTEIGWKTSVLKGSGCAPRASIGRDTAEISDCGTAVPFVFTIRSDGSARINIASVVVTGDPAFQTQPYSLTDLAGNKITLPQQLDVDQVILVYLTFTPAAKASGVFKASVLAISDKGDTAKGSATATVTAVYRQLDATTPTVTIPVVPFGSGVKMGTFRYCNTLSDPVTLQNMLPLPGPYKNAFTITGYSVGGAAKTLPLKLAANECVDITVQFDPSISPDPAQSADYSVVSDACLSVPKATASSGVTLGPPTILGAGLPTILSCGTRDSFVVVTNSNGANSPPMTITNISVTGANPANFITKNPPSNSIPGGKSVNIPFTFAPAPSPGPAATNYTANVVVTLTDAAGKPATLTAPVTGSSNGMSTVISSSFAVTSGQADPNTFLALPITIAFTRNGLADPVDAFGITKITLTYTYNTDILDLVLDANGKAKVTGLPAGWKVASSNIATGKLSLVLTGPVLTDAQASSGALGQLTFTPTLAKSGSKATTVTLAPPSLLTAGGTAVGSCLAISEKGTQFSLVYGCGDSALAYFMTNGAAPSMIKPVSPNPVSASGGGVVSFQYVTRHEGIVSLTIYDELGREAARVVSGQFHPAGTYEVRADVSKFSSGSYIYRFQLDNHHAISGRMVVSN